MLKLYANENFPLETVRVLWNLGYDISTTHERGKSNLSIPDEDVLAFAIAENRAILTVNRKDFMRLHRQNPIHSGIIVCTKNDDLTISPIVFMKFCCPTKTARPTFCSVFTKKIK